MPEALLDGVRAIAVLRPNAVGDFVFALPALHALKDAYPGARIIYIGRQWHAEFLHDRPGPVDEVRVIPPCPGVGMPPGQACDERAIDAFVASLRAQGIDLALQIYGGGRYSNPFIRRLGARLAVGLKAEDAEPLDRWIAYAPLQNRRLQLLEAAALAGAQRLRLERELAVTARDRREAAQAVALPDDAPLVLLQPGSSDARRRWPAQSFARMADVLAGDGAAIAVHGTAAEADIVREVIGRMRHPALDLSGRLSLSALCGLLECSALLV
ncbi:MAG TPA: glycosyltransferase family 9 protein, partial [Noviherbaspirillum sp.]|nr:glycosyltransferase family 9 protein [Noviherbaspirillum sp.]